MKKLLIISFLFCSPALLSANNSDEGKKKKKKEKTEVVVKQEGETKSAAKKAEGTAETDRLKTKSAYENTINTSVK